MSDLRWFKTYGDAENYWNTHAKNDFRGIEDDLAFKIDAVEFVIALEKLHMITGDARFLGAVEALRERGIVSGYSWVHKSPFPFVNSLEERYKDKAAQLVGQFVGHGVSARLAIANTVANLQWPGNSFPAAFKAVERLWRASAKPEG